MHCQSVNPCRVSFSLSSSISSSLVSLFLPLFSLFLFRLLSSLFFIFSLPLNLSVFILSPCGVVVVLLCGVVWCGVCGMCPSTTSRVYQHHAHMLKHTCAWCRYTRRRVEWTHGREGRGGCEGGEKGNRHQPRVFHG